MSRYIPTYTYAARAPLVGGDVAEAQFALRRTYANDLIGIDRRYRVLLEATRRLFCAQLDEATAAVSAAEADVTACLADMRQDRAKEHRRKVADAAEGRAEAKARRAAAAEEAQARRVAAAERLAEAKARRVAAAERLAEAKARRVAAWAAEKEARALIQGPGKPEVDACQSPARGRRKAGTHAWVWADPVYRCDLCSVVAAPSRPPGPLWAPLETMQRQLNEARNRAERAARERARTEGLYWGSYQRVEEAHQLIRQGREPPRFRPVYRPGDDGEIAVHLSNGGTVVPASAVFMQPVGGLRIERVPYAATLTPERAARRAAAGMPEQPQTARRNDHALVHLRVGEAWVIVPIVMHRPLPPGARVLWAWARRCQGKWSVQFVIEVPPREEPLAAGGRVAIDLGWRPVPGGIRVAYWRDDAGQSGQVLCPDDVITRLRHADEIQSMADREFDLAKEVISQFFATVPDWPQWLRDAGAEHVPRWRSRDKMRRLLIQWQDNRLPGDEGIMNRLSSWHEGRSLVAQQQHLAAYAQGRRRRAERIRREVYRNFASFVARTYRQVILEEFDLNAFARAPDADEGAQTEGRELRHLQRLAAPSILRLCVESAIGRSGGTKIKRPAAYTSRMCADCDHINAPTTELFFTCAGCGQVRDQDDNATANLLRAAV